MRSSEVNAGGLFEGLAGRLVVRTAANHWDPRYVHVGLTTEEQPEVMRGAPGRRDPCASSQPAEIAELYARCERVAERFNRMRRARA